jgi:hypothetical protein
MLRAPVKTVRSIPVSGYGISCDWINTVLPLLVAIPKPESLPSLSLLNAYATTSFAFAGTFSAPDSLPFPLPKPSPETALLPFFQLLIAVPRVFFAFLFVPWVTEVLNYEVLSKKTLHYNRVGWVR